MKTANMVTWITDKILDLILLFYFLTEGDNFVLNELQSTVTLI